MSNDNNDLILNPNDLFYDPNKLLFRYGGSVVDGKWQPPVSDLRGGRFLDGVYEPPINLFPPPKNLFK